MYALPKKDPSNVDYELHGEFSVCCKVRLRAKRAQSEDTCKRFVDNRTQNGPRGSMPDAEFVMTMLQNFVPGYETIGKNTGIQ